MMGQQDLEKLLSDYGIDSKKINRKQYQRIRICEYNNVREILDYLVNQLGVKASSIEKCPSILSFQRKNAIEENYNYLCEQGVPQTKIKKALSTLGNNSEDLKYNYTYLKNKVGFECLNNALSSLSTDS